MKKMLVWLLLAAIALSLAACGVDVSVQTTEATQETTAAVAEETVALPSEETTEETTAATTPELTKGIVEELLESEETTTVVFETAEEYEEFLHELGYTEFRMNYHAYMGAGLACRPVSLTYNSQAFRFDFSYMDNEITILENGWETNLDKYRIVEGWVLYGMKGDSAINITGLNFEAYDMYHTSDMLEMFVPKATRELDVCPQIVDTNCYMGELPQNWQGVAYHEARYYPNTGNLYNMMHMADNLEDACFSAPRILLWWDEAIVEALTARGMQLFDFASGTVVNQNQIQPSRGNGHYVCDNLYEPGMTLLEWFQSPYNMDDWILHLEGDLHYAVSYDKQYVVLIPYDSYGNPRTIQSIRSDYYGYILMITYEDYSTYFAQ